MSERDDLRVDADGFVDMDQFDATDPEEALDDATQARLHDILVEAPVPTPPADRFDEWVEQAVDEGPDAIDTAALVPDDAPEEDPLAAPGADLPARDTDDAEPWSDLGDSDFDDDLDDADDPGGPDHV
jgi:hypothetical protein